jgi:hypothetical protein
VTPSTPTASSPSNSATATPVGAELLLEVTTEGGFIAPSARLGQLPTVVVDTAGDIYTPDPNFSGLKLILQATVRDVGPNGAAKIVAAMRAAGLDTVSYRGGPAADAGVTVFTAQIDGEEVVNRITAGGPGGPGRPGASSNPAIDLLSRLVDPNETWGAADVANASYTPSAFKIYAAPSSTTGGTTVEWPLSPSLAKFGTPSTPDFGVSGVRTGVAFGDDATKIAAAFANASADTLVTSDNEVYQVWIRPLLPPEIS